MLFGWGAIEGTLLLLASPAQNLVSGGSGASEPADQQNGVDMSPIPPCGMTGGDFGLPLVGAMGCFFR